MPILENIAAIAKGMSITFKEMFQPTVVETYPDGPGPLRGAKVQERYRGVHVADVVDRRELRAAEEAPLEAGALQRLAEGDVAVHREGIDPRLDHREVGDGGDQQHR